MIPMASNLKIRLWAAYSRTGGSWDYSGYRPNQVSMFFKKNTNQFVTDNCKSTIQISVTLSRALWTLNEKDQISSQSWSYTAGARYRNKGAFGSLIFGGYDTSRFESNDVGFSMTEDVSRDLVVTLRSIMTDQDGEETQLMNTAEFMFIYSFFPEIWLPKEVCDEFEDTFGLQYDKASQQYIVNEEAHDNLVEQNSKITFTLANQKDGGPTVDIVLPCQAFDLTMSRPLWTGKGNTTFYFPIRRGDNSTLFTLGRTFLQEVYVTAHYDSRAFNVSQATHPDPLSPDVIALPVNLDSSESESNSNPTKNDPKNPDDGSGGTGGTGGGLAGGAIAGVIVAAVLAGVLIVTLIFFCCPCASVRLSPSADLPAEQQSTRSQSRSMERGS